MYVARPGSLRRILDISVRVVMRINGATGVSSRYDVSEMCVHITYDVLVLLTVYKHGISTGVH